MAAKKLKKKVKKKFKKKAKIKIHRKTILTRAKRMMPKQAVEVQVSKEDISGAYSNVAFIKHTNREFILDFLFTLHNQTVLSSRVIMSPQHARELLDALGANIKQYEKKYGDIIVK